MRIAFLLPELAISGGVFTVLEHALRFQKAGHEVVVFLQKFEGRPSDEIYEGSSKLNFRKFGRETESFDVAIATWWETAFVIGDIPAKRYAYFVQGFEGQFYQEPFRATQAFIAHTLNQDFIYICVSKALQVHLKNEFGRESVYVPNGINQSQYSTIKPVLPKTEKLRVLVEGPASIPFKRVREALEIASSLDGIETVLLTSSEHVPEHYRADHKFFKIPHSQTAPVYASCDVILKLSTTESFALPVLEMFACGGTAVVAKFAGAEEYLRDGENSLLVKIDDFDSVKEKLKRLRDDRELLERLKKNAKMTSNSYSWDASNGVFLNALEGSLKFDAGRLGPKNLAELGLALADYKTTLRLADHFRLLLNKVPMAKNLYQRALDRRRKGKEI